jgi:hypothetical protein
MLPAAVVRNLVVCENIVSHHDNAIKVDLLGVVANLHVADPLSEHFLFAELCIYAALSEARGTATLQVRCVQHPEGNLVFTTPLYRQEFRNDPLEVIGLPFRVRRCRFPQLGLYAFQLWYNAEMLEERFVRLR